MDGPRILARYLEQPSPEADQHGNYWQYNSRSDRHSKVGCWGIAFDLLQASSLLKLHADQGKVILGVNHSMTDHSTQRRKRLDLVIARPADNAPSKNLSFRTLAVRYGVFLTEDERQRLESLPQLPVANVGAVLVALEAKAAMTAHIKALPRLYDELNSSHLCVHGASPRALAIGYVQVNLAREFVSSVTNNHLLGTRQTKISYHNQPGDTLRVLHKMTELPRRSHSSEVGFDGLGVSVLNFENRGGTVLVVDDPPAPQPGDPFRYENMIIRMANEYDTRFASI